MRVLLVNCSPVRDGATAELVNMVRAHLGGGPHIRSVCIDDYHISFCKGCRRCHATAQCVQDDDVPRLMGQYQWADVIVSVSPSYWADVPIILLGKFLPPKSDKIPLPLPAASSGKPHRSTVFNNFHTVFNNHNTA